MRKQVGISEHDPCENDPSSMKSKAVVYEIFYSMVREVRDEVQYIASFLYAESTILPTCRLC